MQLILILADTPTPYVIKPGSFARLAASQMLRRQGLQQRNDLYTRQPSEETGEQVLNPLSWRWGAQATYRIRKQGGLRCGERWLKVRKMYSNWGSVQAYLSYVLLHGLHVQKMVAFTWSEGEVFGLLMSKGYPLDSHPVHGLDWFDLGKTSSVFLKNNLSNCYYSDSYIRGVIGRTWSKESCDILAKLHEAWRVCNLQEQLRQAWLKTGYKILFIKQVMI